MIVVDTSALMAIVLDEELADPCIDALVEAPHIAISAGTVAEAMIVADRKVVGDRMRRLLGKFSFEVVAITSAESGRIADAYSLWGKGVHPARLNLGDCFAYALAKDRNCPLLFVGEDFRRTDIESVL